LFCGCYANDVKFLRELMAGARCLRGFTLIEVVVVMAVFAIC
jgi:prepilin-type N-terminal cleavage/methylation domain-containing protein